jgi:Ser/Thr protein kinase RdoA (MazF antagonist)
VTVADGSGERAPTEELRDALEHALTEELGAERRITRLERSPCVFSSSFALEELRVELDDDSTLDLMFKDLGEHGLSERARAAKPQFLYDPLREIDAYRSILVPAELGTASFYGAAVDPAQNRYWLFIERVPGVALWQIGELEVWQRAARWAASMHSRFDGEAIVGDHLLRYDADFYRLWLQRAVEFADRWEARRPGIARRGIEWLSTRYDPVVERLTALPPTFIHGELYASNVLVAGEGDRARVCPIDWEIAAVGPGLIDLAALTMGWGEPERTALATAYLDAHGRSDRMPSAETFLETLGYARLHLAVQWLGWAPDWRPPRSHRRDWVGEALGLAEELGL